MYVVEEKTWKHFSILKTCKHYPLDYLTKKNY